MNSCFSKISNIKMLSRCFLPVWSRHVAPTDQGVCEGGLCLPALPEDPLSEVGRGGRAPRPQGRAPRTAVPRGRGLPRGPRAAGDPGALPGRAGATHLGGEVRAINPSDYGGDGARVVIFCIGGGRWLVALRERDSCILGGCHRAATVRGLQGTMAPSGGWYSRWRCRRATGGCGLSGR